MYKRGTVILDIDNTAYQLKKDGWWYQASNWEAPINLRDIDVNKVIWEPEN